MKRNPGFLEGGCVIIHAAAPHNIGNIVLLKLSNVCREVLVVRRVGDQKLRPFPLCYNIQILKFKHNKMDRVLLQSIPITLMFTGAAADIWGHARRLLRCWPGIFWDCFQKKATRVPDPSRRRRRRPATADRRSATGTRRVGRLGIN